MQLHIDVELNYRTSQRTPVLLQIEVADLQDQATLDASLALGELLPTGRPAAEDGVGRRFWLSVENQLSCTYSAKVDISRIAPQLSGLEAAPLERLPDEVIKYLMPSRYCPTDQFQSFVLSEFDQNTGGDLIAAMVAWIDDRFQYVPGASNAQTTAIETFVQRQGVCRDYAHMLIALARAAGIPARFVAGYAPDVDPPDFHAVAEVYLQGAWHLLDATGMATADEFAIVGVGADAAHVPFMSSFGPIELVNQSVRVTRA